LKNFLQSDIVSRLIAFVLAIVVWIYVVVLLDPPIDITFGDIPILYTNTVDLTKGGYILTNEKTDTVSIKVRGSRTMLAKINKSEITAFADLNGYYQTGTITIPISVRLPFSELSVIEKKPYGVNVTLDKIVTQSFPVTVEIIGIPETGFEVYESIASQSVVELQGPGELVASIERVVATVDVSGVNDDILVTRELGFYNTNGDAVLNKYLTSAPNMVEVRCEVLKRKTIAINPIIKDAAEGFDATVISSGQITILGRPDVLEHITQVDTAPINASGITKTTKVTAQLDLPANTFALGNISEVTVEIRQNVAQP